MSKEKIAIKTKIKKVTDTTNDKGTCHDVKFKDMDFSESQIERLKELLTNKTEVTVTIEPFNEQAKLPLEDKK
jgi:hypothetical protein